VAVTPLAAVLPAARSALIEIACLAFGSWPAGGTTVTADAARGDNGAVGGRTPFGTVFSPGGGTASLTPAADADAGSCYAAGASLNGNSSGAGGNGVPGFPLIITHFA
jgi:hypothetical protein